MSYVVIDSSTEFGKAILLGNKMHRHELFFWQYSHKFRKKIIFFETEVWMEKFPISREFLEFKNSTGTVVNYPKEWCAPKRL